MFLFSPPLPCSHPIHPTGANRSGTVKKGHTEDLSKPTLKAVILDFSSVNNVDVTSVQQLIDVRNQLDRYTSPDTVDWHVACINNRWTKRALVSAGFGYVTERPDGFHHRWQPIFSVAEIGGNDSAAAAAEHEANEKELSLHPGRVSSDDKQRASGDLDAIERGAASSTSSGSIKKGREPSGEASAINVDVGQAIPAKRRVAVHGLNRPLFHIDLTSALQSAIANVEARNQFMAGAKDPSSPPPPPPEQQ